MHQSLGCRSGILSPLRALRARILYYNKLSSKIFLAPRKAIPKFCIFLRLHLFGVLPPSTSSADACSRKGTWRWPIVLLGNPCATSHHHKCCFCRRHTREVTASHCRNSFAPLPSGLSHSGASSQRTCISWFDAALAVFRLCARSACALFLIII